MKDSKQYPENLTDIFLLT